MAFKTKPTIRFKGRVKSEPVVYKNGSTAVSLDVRAVYFLEDIDSVYFTKEGLKRLLRRGVQLSCRETVPFSIDDRVVVYTTEELVSPGLHTLGSPEKSITDVLPLTVKHKGEVYSFKYP